MNVIIYCEKCDNELGAIPEENYCADLKIVCMECVTRGKK